MALTRYMQLGSRSNQLVLLVQGFMSAATSSIRGKTLLCGKLPPYSTDAMGKRKQRAVQGWKTVEHRTGREKRKIKTLLTNIHL